MLTRIPRPVRSRAKSASVTAPKSATPEGWSPEPAGIGPSQASRGNIVPSMPERDQYTTVSYAGLSTSGPASPKPLAPA